jgi:hypothetical protein
VDAAYAGSAFICEEFRIYAKGLEVEQNKIIDADCKKKI